MMLVLHRKRDENVIVTPPGNIGELVVTVVEVRGEKVRLGFQCPREWAVHRGEIYAAIQRERELKKEEEGSKEE